MHVGQLPRARLAEATRVLEEACAFDRAAAVADEKLFGPGPQSAVQTVGAWDEAENLVGVAAISSRWLRLLAVAPRACRAGVGSALLARCETLAKADGQTTLSALDQPGNYLAPGVDVRNLHAIAWLEKRGFARGAESRTNVLLDVRDNPRVSPARLAELVERARERGYEIRRARRDERSALCAAIAQELGGAWPYEVERALGHEPAGAHVAVRDGAYCGFAAHDGNNRGLGWFGPTATWPAHRRQGLGEALLMACLVDVAAEHPQCEVAWIGPRAFYDKVAGVAADRHFVPLSKSLV